MSNPTNRPITLERGHLLGAVESVSAIVPLTPAEDQVQKDPKIAADKGDEPSKVDVNHVEVAEAEPLNFDLSHLTPEQRKIAEKVLEEERDVFCTGKEDHGNCPDLQMELNLSDNIPVVVPHRQIPRPLYDEVKNFINDLIANNWIRESKSSYSSPIVCVRKKTNHYVFASTIGC